MSRPLLTADQVAYIGRHYDGTSASIDTLLEKFTHLRRHNIRIAAKRAGFKSDRKRKKWTPADDQYVRDHYGRLPAEDIAAHLGCTLVALTLRKRRLGVSTRDFEDLTVRDLEELTKMDHRLWQRFFEDGWLKHWEQPRRNATPAQRVSLDNLKAFFTAHPEVFDYRAADAYVKGVLELESLPEPPRYKRLTCHSGSMDDRVVDHCTPGPYGRGDRTKRLTAYEYSLDSCKALGGTDFWAPIYAVGPTCPRCGSLVSRFSEKALFSDVEPGEDERLAMLADKLGLQWNGQAFTGPGGDALSDADLLRYVFNSRRNPGDAVRTFRRLLETGLTVMEKSPVPPDRLLPNLLDYEMKPGQQLVAWSDFLAEGNLGVYWPPGQGKMFFLAMVMTRLPGEHVIFANTSTLVEQWIQHLRSHAPSVRVQKIHKPFFHRVTVFDAAGAVRCVVDLFTYMTAFDFSSRRYVVAGFDEAHFLPGNSAHRLAMVPCEYRIGLTATPYREDGRADLIHRLTGKAIGSDWQQFRDEGALASIPVRVLVVDDMESKFKAITHLVARRKTLVMVELLEDGRRVAEDLGVPFVHSLTKNRLDTIANSRTVVASRVADCGIDVVDLEEVIEFGFQRGSRAQSLQRVGRLLHSRKPVRHTVLMTREEFSRYHKRLTALEDKGFKITIAFHRPREAKRITRPMSLAGNRWMQMLGAGGAVHQPAINSRRYVDGRAVA